MQRVEDVLARPFMVMFSEPMLIALALYISVCSILHFKKKISVVFNPGCNSSSTDASIFFSRHTLWFLPKGTTLAPESLALCSFLFLLAEYLPFYWYVDGFSCPTSL